MGCPRLHEGWRFVSAETAGRKRPYLFHPEKNRSISAPAEMDGPAADECPFKFSSEYLDSETNLVYYNYRYYSPELGRWTKRDSIEEDGGWNLYLAFYNDVTNYYDFLGRESYRTEEYDFTEEDLERGADSNWPESKKEAYKLAKKRYDEDKIIADVLKKRKIEWKKCLYLQFSTVPSIVTAHNIVQQIKGSFGFSSHIEKKRCIFTHSTPTMRVPKCKNLQVRLRSLNTPECAGVKNKVDNLETTLPYRINIQATITYCGQPAVLLYDESLSSTVGNSGERWGWLSLGNGPDHPFSKPFDLHLVLDGEVIKTYRIEIR